MLRVSDGAPAPSSGAVAPSGGAPAPSGHRWCFQYSVGVDCRDAEPRCIWLAVLKGACPCPPPIASPKRRGFRWLARRHRPSWAEGRTDVMVSTKDSRRHPRCSQVEGVSNQVEGMSCHRPITMFLHKNSQGFGFTLRHFIIFPPESTLNSLKDEENGNAAGKGAQWRRLEPMDTIFVKSVKEQSPAHQAGLCPGDRLVQVNGHSVLGRSYSQVIALIQNSGNVLELSVMQKGEDVLQLVTVFSQDSYLQDSEPDRGGAQLLLEPQPLCYSPLRSGHAPSSTLDNWQCRADATPPQPCHAPSSSLDNFGCRVDNTPPQSGHAPSMSLDNWQCQADANPPQPGHAPSSSLDNWQCRAGAASPPLDNRLAATPISAPGPSPAPGRYRIQSTSALSALDFHFTNHDVAITCATLPPPRRASGALRHQALSDWYYSQAQAAERMSPRHRSVSQDRLAELGLGLALGPGPPVVSTTTEQHRRETLLNHHRATVAAHDSHWLDGWAGSRSCSESLLAAYAEYQHNYGRSVETLAQASALVRPHRQLASQSPHEAACGAATAFLGGAPTVTPDGQQPGKAENPGQQEQVGQLELVGQLGRQVAEPQTRCVKEDKLLGSRSHSPCFTRRTSHHLYQSSRDPSASADKGAGPRPQSTPTLCAPEEDRDLPSPVVVLRQKQPHRSTSSPDPGGPSAARRASGSLAQQALDSLSSIPFIGSFKARRSSYLLAVTPERSKSCDEGLNSFREESRVFSKLPKRVRSFFTDGSLDSLRAAHNDTQSKRHSTSELGGGIGDTRREGWLHYKVLTERGKKVGGGMRPWKRAFCVLCSHWFFLYRDKREALLQGAGPEAGTSQDQHPPVSVRGCLVGVAYGATKRKHVLRLTTQDATEFLLQTEDGDDMLAWLGSIRDASRTDGEVVGSSRDTLINRKLKDRKYSLTGNRPDSSPRLMMMIPPFLQTSSVKRSSRCDEKQYGWSLVKKNKKTGSPKAFGVRLEECQPAVQHKCVPLVVEMCCAMVEASGLEYQGIYRVPGNNAMVSNLQEHLNRGLDINTAEERCQDLNVISSLLKNFFRKLPEPLFTDDRYLDFIEANRLQDAEQRLKTMKKLIRELPDYYRHTLKFLVEHLKKVADHAEENKMEPRNLALVFGPTLVRTSEDNMMDMVTHLADRYQIVETLILHSDWFFGKGNLENRQKTPVDQLDMHLVPNIDHLLPNIGRASGGVN